jgi:hypothetical protein
MIFFYFVLTYTQTVQIPLFITYKQYGRTHVPVVLIVPWHASNGTPSLQWAWRRPSPPTKTVRQRPRSAEGSVAIPTWLAVGFIHVYTYGFIMSTVKFTTVRLFSIAQHRNTRSYRRRTHASRYTQRRKTHTCIQSTLTFVWWLNQNFNVVLLSYTLQKVIFSWRLNKD